MQENEKIAISPFSDEPLTDSKFLVFVIKFESDYVGCSPWSYFILEIVVIRVLYLPLRIF